MSSVQADIYARTAMTWMGMNESIYRLNGSYKIITQINLINQVQYFDVVGVTRLVAGHRYDGLELHN